LPWCEKYPTTSYPLHLLVDLFTCSKEWCFGLCNTLYLYRDLDSHIVTVLCSLLLFLLFHIVSIYYLTYDLTNFVYMICVLVALIFTQICHCMITTMIRASWARALYFFFFYLVIPKDKFNIQCAFAMYRSDECLINEMKWNKNKYITLVV
jgi:hypothetical protein